MPELVTAVPGASRGAGSHAAPAESRDYSLDPLANAADPCAFDEPEAGPSGAPLLGGEEEMISLRGAVLFPNTSRQVIGTVVVTNYAVHFVRDAGPGGAGMPLPGQGGGDLAGRGIAARALRHFPVPVGAIAKVVHKDVVSKKGEATPTLRSRPGVAPYGEPDAPGSPVLGGGGGGSTAGSPTAAPSPRDSISGPSGVSGQRDRMGLVCKDFRRIVLQHPNIGAAARAIVNGAFPGDQRALFAYVYRPAVTQFRGDVLADQMLHFARIHMTREWRVCDANADYSLCSTYPRLFAVPAAADDNLVRQVAAYRTRERLPILSWCSHATGAVIVRSSQPRAGIMGKRSPFDDLYLRSVAASSRDGQTLRIIDARPRKNAIGNRVKGGGYEGHLVKDGTLTFAGIERIQVMRRSLDTLVAGIDAESGRVDPAAIEKSEWLLHVRLVLDASALAARTAHCHGESVLVHCSDGWDRTAQICALAQIIADPFYRTFAGFAILVEKEWLLVGHKFATRVGHASGDHGHDQRSPIFIQFLDAVWQLLQMCPDKFEFMPPFLRAIADALYSCQYGNFLYDCPRVREEEGVYWHTTSLWTELMVRRQLFANPMYESDTQPLPIVRLTSDNPLELMVWTELYGM